jgi:hypothetical protein
MLIALMDRSAQQALGLHVAQHRSGALGALSSQRVEEVMIRELYFRVFAL